MTPPLVMPQGESRVATLADAREPAVTINESLARPIEAALQAATAALVGSHSGPVAGVAAAAGVQGIIELLRNHLDGRRSSWAHRVAKTIGLLHRGRSDSALHTVLTHDEFVDALIQCSLVALKHHETETLRQLQNALANCACQPYGDHQKHRIFISFIDVFVPFHTWLLKALSTTERDTVFVGTEIPFDRNRSIEDVVLMAYPKDSSFIQLTPFVLSDLKNKGLARVGTMKELLVYGDRAGQNRATDLGVEFLGFVDKPIGADEK